MSTKANGKAKSKATKKSTDKPKKAKKPEQPNAETAQVAQEEAPAEAATAEDVTQEAAAVELPQQEPETSEEEHVMSENVVETQATETATPAPAPVAEAPKPPRKIERRVYVGHKQHGTCVSFDAKVFLAPEGREFAPKSAPRLIFTVGEGQLVDEEGGIWLESCENPGCGPRCPVSLREMVVPGTTAKYGEIWRAMSHNDRAEIIKSLAKKPEEGSK